jgi:hypothetical protein
LIDGDWIWFLVKPSGIFLMGKKEIIGLGNLWNRGEIFYFLRVGRLFEERRVGNLFVVQF